MQKFKPASVAAVNQCSGIAEPLQRAAGGQWGNGAMGNAMWTGVRLRELLDAAARQERVGAGAVEARHRAGPKGWIKPFLKSLELTNTALDETIVAYLMNGEAAAMLNGFPVRLVVLGNFATYWTKSLSWIRALETPDDNFWMKTAYRIPGHAARTTTPEDMKSRQSENHSDRADAGAVVSDLSR